MIFMSASGQLKAKEAHCLRSITKLHVVLGEGSWLPYQLELTMRLRHR